MSAPLITDELFSEWIRGMGTFEPSPTVAVAVSGGLDSMCLLYLADRWVRRLGGRVVALTVDHGLRKESSEEAAQVKRWATRVGIAHTTLQWQEEKPDKGIQEKARDARYGLLLSWCREQGILHLLMGHHLNDSLETWLMRAARMQSRNGPVAVGIPPVTVHPWVRIIRPLITCKREHLENMAKERQIPFLRDPSNESFTYERVQWRTLLQLMEPSFLSATHTAADFALARARKDYSTALEAWQALLCLSPAGYAFFSFRGFLKVKKKEAAMGLKWLLTVINGKSYPPSLPAVESVILRLREGVRCVTLHRCFLVRYQDKIYVGREVRSREGAATVKPGEHIRWDDRFLIENEGASPCIVSGWHTAMKSPLAAMPRKLFPSLLTMTPQGLDPIIIDGGVDAFEILRKAGVFVMFSPHRSFSQWSHFN